MKTSYKDLTNKKYFLVQREIVVICKPVCLTASFRPFFILINARWFQMTRKKPRSPPDQNS